MTIKMTSAEYESKYGQNTAQATPQMAPVAPQESFGGKISNAFNSGVSQMKQGFSQAQAATNPFQAVESGITLGAGAINTAFSPLAPVTAPIGQGIQAVANKVSDNPTVQNFAMSPAGQTTARVAEDVGNLATIAGTAAGGVKAPEVAVGAGKLAVKPIAPLVRATGRAMKGAGEGAYGITVAPSEATAKAMLAYDSKQPNFAGRVKNMMSGEGVGIKPITEANTAARKGLVGTEYQIGVQAQKVSNDLWEKTIAPKLDEVKGQVNMKSFFDEVEKDISKTKELGRRNALKEALQSMRENYQNVGAPVNLKTLQSYKEGWAKYIPEATYKGKPIGSALKDVQNIAAQKARGIIYKHVGEEGKQAYLDYGNLKSIIESGAKSITGDVAKRTPFREGWKVIMDKAVTPVATFAGKVLYKTGEGLEFVGKKGAKTVKQALD